MNAGQLLLLAKDIITVLENDGIIKSDGSIVFPPSVQPEVVLAAQIETALRNRGLTIPADVDKVLAVLPLVLQIAGVK